VSVPDPEEIGCVTCGAEPSEPCRASSGKRSRPHARRKADAKLERAEPGWIPTEPTAVVIDFEAARLRKLGRENGLLIP
jgi:hypothetical protein